MGAWAFLLHGPPSLSPSPLGVLWAGFPGDELGRREQRGRQSRAAAHPTPAARPGCGSRGLAQSGVMVCGQWAAGAVGGSPGPGKERDTCSTQGPPTLGALTATSICTQATPAPPPPERSPAPWGGQRGPRSERVALVGVRREEAGVVGRERMWQQKEPRGPNGGQPPAGPASWLRVRGEAGA